MICSVASTAPPLLLPVSIVVYPLSSVVTRNVYVHHASCHGALGVDVVEVTVTNEIPKQYSNDIPNHDTTYLHTYTLAEMWIQISYLLLLAY